jgi:PAS domain S-box-containing protein
MDGNRRFQQFIRPPVFSDEEKTVQAKLLHTLLMAVLIMNSCFSLAFLLLLPGQLNRLVVVGGVFAVIAITWILMQRGFIRGACWSMISMLWLLTTMAGVTANGPQAPAFIGYTAIIVLAGLLLPGRSVLFWSSLNSLAILALIYADNRGIPLPQLNTPTPLTYWVAHTGFYFVVAIALHLATQTARDSLTQKTLNNQQLQKNKDALQAYSSKLSQLNTALRKSEEQALLEQERLEKIISAIPGSVVITSFDEKGTVLWANEEISQLVGFSSEELFGNSIPQFYENLQDREHVLRQVRQNGRIRNHEFKAKDVQGRTLWLRSSVQSLHYNDSPALLAIVERIDDIKKAQEMLRRTDKLDSLGVLAGGVAHDFNNLLVALLTQTSIALAKLPHDHASVAHIEKARSAAKRAAVLTQHMLAFSGHGQFQVEAFCLNHLLHENMDLFLASIPKRIHLQLELAQSLPYIEADAGQMQQMVMNMLLNAADAIGEWQGTITLCTSQQTVEKRDGRYDHYTGTPLPSGDYVCLEVVDGGAGMKPEIVERIFDPFFTTKEAGRGLGLAAVLGIVRGHKGGINVSSQVGAGTTFQLVFPVCEWMEAEVEEETAVPAKPHIHSILIIDDETAVCEAVKDILEMEDIEVLIANNGEVGIQVYEQHQTHIDLVLLDLSMPIMGGEETLYQLLSIDPEAKVILSSGYSESEITRRFIGSGLTGFLQKPYDSHKLLMTLQKHLS